MSSLADAPDLVGFFSYSREDDEDSGGKLSKLRERIQAELRVQLGRTRKDFRLWQDKVAIAHGELWEDTIKKGIAESVFFIPIITPTAVRSSYCKFEFESFLTREKELDRNNLIFPILYVPVPALTDDRWRQDPLLAIIGSRQYEEWQNLRHLDASSSEVVALRVQTFCANICRALEQEWLSPEERREAEARQREEDERRRQEAENKRRLDEAEAEKRRRDQEERRRKGEAEKRQRDEEERRRQETITLFDIAAYEAALDLRLAEAEAEAEKRRQDEERQRLEQEAKLDAKEAQRRRTQLEQKPQQPVKLWLLPLIGGIAASLSVLLIALIVTAIGWLFLPGIIMASLIAFLYGGAAGMLIRRFGIVKAVAIPVIPYALLVIGLFATANPLTIVAIYVVPPVVCTFLAFWLHSKWARRRRMIDSGLVPP
jgi:TIR domain